jgi:hypothetical protein
METLFLHCKKKLAIFPSPAGMSLNKLSLGGKTADYSRHPDILAGDGKTAVPFFTVYLQYLTFQV